MKPPGEANLFNELREYPRTLQLGMSSVAKCAAGLASD
jgi:hypothetical protein